MKAPIFNLINTLTRMTTTITKRYRTTKDMVEHHAKIVDRIVALSPSKVDAVLCLFACLFFGPMTAYERKYYLSLKLHKQAKELEARIRERTSVSYPAMHLN